MVENNKRLERDIEELKEGITRVKEEARKREESSRIEHDRMVEEMLKSALKTKVGVEENKRRLIAPCLLLSPSSHFLSSSCLLSKSLSPLPLSVFFFFFTLFQGYNHHEDSR
jgi:hypothetical protein